MIPSQIRSGAAFFILSASALIAQPYHNDAVVGGVQTLEVEGDLSVKQYGGGFGGDLNVVGDAKIAQGGQALPGLPSGVSGTYYGTLKLGSSTNIGEYVFEKTGDDVSGDFIVPLGCFGTWEGAAIQIDVLTGPDDADSGAANFTIMSKRHRYHGDLTAVTHSAIAGGKGIKIHGWNTHGMTYLFLEFDATSNNNTVHAHRAVVRISTVGNMSPLNRDASFSQAIPIRLANSLVSDAVFGNEMTHSFNGGSIALNGNVAVPSGKSLTVGGSAVLTEAELDAALASAIPPTTTAWTSAFVARGTVSNGASLATGSSVASGSYAIANGSAGAKATGAFSYANGNLTVASGSNSYANGFGATASGGFSRANGSGAIASGSYAAASGLNAKANGNYSMASGHYVEVHAFGETAFGSANLTDPLGAADAWGELDYLFHVGNGTAPSSRSDALTILKNGQTTLTNKNWKLNVGSDPTSVLNDPPSATDSGGNALVIEGHAIMKGKVILEQAQGDISMGIYQ
jgi:hypothetical protein